MENISVSTILTTDDWRALRHAAGARLWSRAKPRQRLLMRAPFALLVVMLLVGLFLMPGDHEVRAFVVGIFGTFLLGVIQIQINDRAAEPKSGGLFLGAVRYLFSAEGIQVERDGSTGCLAWSNVLGVDYTPTHIFIWLAESTGYAVPARSLSGGLDAAILADKLRAFIVQSKVSSTQAGFVGMEPPMVPPPPPPAPAPPRVTLPRELAALGKQLLFLKANPARLAGSDRAIGLLAGIALLIWLPLDWLIYTGPMEFALEQIGGLAFVATGALALAWILSRLSVPRVEYRRALLIVAGAMFIAIIGSALYTLSAESWLAGTLVLVAMTAYAVQYFKLALRTLTGSVQMRALLVAAIATSAFVVTMDALYINPSLWVYPADDDSEPAAGTNYQDAWRRVEDAQFGQQARIDAEVAKIAAHSAPGPQVYFVGFAGFGEQRVFAQEIELAARQVAERYDAGDREVLLVNDRRDLEKHPLATAQALRHTLGSLGKVMDSDDVLFLALSSHGSDDATISISNEGMAPSDLDAEELADALRESGIRWKVIVISACYAGGFIDALEDDHTIVLTAAAADRTSFGCADDRDLTYFGEAFYRDALPRAKSLRAAFEAARASIAQREKAEGIEASNPQASYGVDVSAKLQALESK